MLTSQPTQPLQMNINEYKWKKPVGRPPQVGPLSAFVLCEGGMQLEV